MFERVILPSFILRSLVIDDSALKGAILLLNLESPKCTWEIFCIVGAIYAPLIMNDAD